MIPDDSLTPESRIKLQNNLIHAEMALSTVGINKDLIDDTFWSIAEQNSKDKIMNMSDGELTHHLFVVSPKLHKAFANAIKNQ